MDVLIIVPGRAYSGNARSAIRYKQTIYDAAKPHFATPLRQKGLRVRVDHFYTTRNLVDLDNLLKCVLDGLKGAAYEDDSQVDEVSIRRYNVSVSPTIRNPRVGLLEYIARGQDFLSIEIGIEEV